MKNLIIYIPALCVFAGFLLVSIGSFVINLAMGFIISGLLLFILGYMYTNKGGEP